MLTMDQESQYVKDWPVWWCLKIHFFFNNSFNSFLLKIFEGKDTFYNFWDDQAVPCYLIYGLKELAFGIFISIGQRTTHPSVSVLWLVKSPVNIPSVLKRPTEQKVSVRLTLTGTREYALASCIGCSRYVRVWGIMLLAVLTVSWL